MSSISFQSYGHVTMGTSFGLPPRLNFAKGPAFACTGAFGWKGCVGSGAYVVEVNGESQFACPSCLYDHGWRTGHDGILTLKITLETLEKEECMCDKKELEPDWNLAIGPISQGKYKVNFHKVTRHNQGATVSSDDLTRTFDSFDEAMKYVNDTYKILK